MSQPGRRPIVKLLLWIGVPALLLGLVRPWTIRPLEGRKPAAFDAATFASSVWPRLVQEATQAAADVPEPATAPAVPTAKARFVKGSGVVTAVDRQSRVGMIRVRLSGARPGSATAAIQIGPVIRGTALRDASSFIAFSQFTNQIDYAAAANALNDHAFRSVIAQVPLDSLQGRTITFIGAASGSAVRDDVAIEVVPLSIVLTEDAGR